MNVGEHLENSSSGYLCLYCHWAYGHYFFPPLRSYLSHLHSTFQFRYSVSSVYYGYVGGLRESIKDFLIVSNFFSAHQHDLLSILRNLSTSLIYFSCQFCVSFYRSIDARIKLTEVISSLVSKQAGDLVKGYTIPKFIKEWDIHTQTLIDYA